MMLYIALFDFHFGTSAENIQMNILLTHSDIDDKKVEFEVQLSQPK